MKTQTEDPSVEADRILRFFAGTPNGNTTATRRVLRQILLQTDGWIFSCGYIFDIQAKSLGAGVYRITTKKR